jgi:fatty acid desaturase
MTAEKARSIGFYAQHVRQQIPARYFEPSLNRLFYIFLYLGLSVGSIWLMAQPETTVWMKLGLSLVIGWSFGSFGFLAHELLHGSIVRSTFWQTTIAWFMLVPFFVSPTFWRYWHNRLHHSKTQQLIVDPDAFPTLKIFRHSKFLQFMFPFTPGSGHKRSYGYFFFWFSFNTFVAQTYFRFRNKQFEHLDQKRVTVEFLALIASWAGVLWFVGPSNWLWVFVIPFFIQNYMIMHYISTNHNISPLTKHNDPLINSLTVTNNKALEWLHFNFGYHVEHHIFPTMSTLHIKRVHEVLKKDFPDTYQYTTIDFAMAKLYQTPRIYKTANVLIHPDTLKTFDIESYAKGKKAAFANLDIKEAVSSLLTPEPELIES